LKRRLKWIAIGLVVLVVAAAAAFEVLRRTDLPRQWALGAIEGQVPLAIDFEELALTWGGETTIRGLTVRLPLSERSIFEADRLVVHHRNLLGLALTQHPGEIAVKAGRVDVRLAEGKDGRWNVQRLVELFGDGGEGGGPTLRWPSIDIAALAVHVERSDGREAVLGPGPVSGAPQGATWRFEATVQPVLLNGRVMMRPPFSHQVAVQAGPLNEVIGLFADAPPMVQAALELDGRAADGRYLAAVDLTEVAVDAMRIDGELAIEAGGERIRVRPKLLRLRPSAEGETSMTLLDGLVEVGGPVWRVRKLDVSGYGTAARLSGTWDTADQRAQLEGRWRGAVGGAVSHEGTLTVEATRRVPDRITIEAAMEGEALTPVGRWTVAADLAGRGEVLGRFDWQLQVPELSWRRDARPPIVLRDLVLEIDQSGSRLEIPTVRGLAGRLQGAGRVDLSTGSWELDVSTRSWSPDERVTPLDVAIAGAGEPGRVEIRASRLVGGGIAIEGEGDYEPERATPLKLALTAQVDLDELRAVRRAMAARAAAVASGAAGGGPDADAAATAGPAEPAAIAEAAPTAPEPPTEPAAWSGQWTWSGEVTGEPRAGNLRVAGTLGGESIVINGQALPDVQMPLVGAISPGQVTIDATSTQLFEGEMTLSGRFDVEPRLLDLDLQLEKVQLQPMAAMIQPNLAQFHGVADATLDLQIPLAEWQAMQVTGDWTVRPFEAPGLTADRLTGRLRTRGTTLRLEPLKVVQGEASATGWARFDLSEARTIHATLQLDDWPWALPQVDLSVQADGTTQVRVDIVDRLVVGGLDITATVRRAGHPIGRIDLAGRLDRERLDIDRITGDLLGGRIEGQIDLPFGDWSTGRGELRWSAFEPGRWFARSPPSPPEGEAAEAEAEPSPASQAGDEPAAEPTVEAPDRATAETTDEAGPAAPGPWLLGRASAQLTFGPTEEPTAPEPMRVELEWQSHALRMREMPIGGGTAVVWAGPGRLLLDELIVPVADGELRVWANNRQRQDRWFTHTQVRFDGLDLRALRNAVATDQRYLTGRVSGRGQVVGFLDAWEAMTGRAQVEITDADLIDTDIFGNVLAALGAIDEPEPTGMGSASIRLDDASLIIERLSYFNRGVELHAYGRVSDLPKGLNSPLFARVAGRARPLKGVPVLRNLDEMFAALQGSVTAARVTGTLGEPTVELAALAEAGEGLGELLTAERPGQGEIEIEEPE